MPAERFEDRLRHTVHRLRTGDNWTGMSQTQIVSSPKWVMLDLDSAERLADLVVAVRALGLHFVESSDGPPFVTFCPEGGPTVNVRMTSGGLEDWQRVAYVVDRHRNALAALDEVSRG